MMRARILEHMAALYGTRIAAELTERLEGMVGRQPVPESARRARPLTERDAMLITYGDQIREPGEVPLRTLAASGRRWWRDLVSAVHILPFYPYSSDDGFSVKDYETVDPALGDWGDVRELAGDFELMFDAVFNHLSARSEWFSRFLVGDAEFADYFVTIEGEPDLSRVVRPRALPLLTEFRTARGVKRVWTTFSADQVDLNLKNPEVLIRLTEVLLGYVAQGARWIRLDAIAYLWKEPGTSCIHLPQAHRIIQLWRAILDELAPGVRLITETNVPHLDNLSYFGDGTNEAQLVYNFALPPLVWHTVRTGSAAALARWARTLRLPSDEVTFFNFLASHDGIGLNPARGLLAPAEIEALVECAVAHGGYVSYKHNPDGSRSPYELNLNYFDALSDPAGGEPLEQQVSRFLCAQSILLTLQGVPGIYVHSLLGSRGDRAAAEASGIPRRINRAKIDRQELERELAQPDALRAQVFGGFGRMLRVRRRYPEFRPAAPQEVWAPQPEILVVRRGDPEREGAIWCVHNVSSKEMVFEWPGDPSAIRSVPQDLLEESAVMEGWRIPLGPYGVRWLRQSGCL
jgi:glucosylglycerate phosphorylase